MVPIYLLANGVKTWIKIYEILNFTIPIISPQGSPIVGVRYSDATDN